MTAACQSLITLLVPPWVPFHVCVNVLGASIRGISIGLTRAMHQITTY